MSTTPIDMTDMPIYSLSDIWVAGTVDPTTAASQETHTDYPYGTGTSSDPVGMSLYSVDDVYVHVVKEASEGGIQHNGSTLQVKGGHNEGIASTNPAPPDDTDDWDNPSLWSAFTDLGENSRWNELPH